MHPGSPSAQLTAMHSLPAPSLPVRCPASSRGGQRGPTRCARCARTHRAVVVGLPRGAAKVNHHHLVRSGQPLAQPADGAKKGQRPSVWLHAAACGSHPTACGRQLPARWGWQQRLTWAGSHCSSQCTAACQGPQWNCCKARGRASRQHARDNQPASLTHRRPVGSQGANSLGAGRVERFHAVGGAEQDILRLEVGMHQAQAVHEGHRL